MYSIDILMLPNPEATVNTEIEEDHEILMKFASFFGAKVDHIFHCSPLLQSRHGRAFRAQNCGFPLYKTEIFLTLSFVVAKWWTLSINWHNPSFHTKYFDNAELLVKLSRFGWLCVLKNSSFRVSFKIKTTSHSSTEQNFTVLAEGFCFLLLVSKLGFKTQDTEEKKAGKWQMLVLGWQSGRKKLGKKYKHETSKLCMEEWSPMPQKHCMYSHKWHVVQLKRFHKKWKEKVKTGRGGGEWFAEKHIK